MTSVADPTSALTLAGRGSVGCHVGSRRTLNRARSGTQRFLAGVWRGRRKGRCRAGNLGLTESHPRGRESLVSVGARMASRSEPCCLAGPACLVGQHTRIGGGLTTSRGDLIADDMAVSEAVVPGVSRSVLDATLGHQAVNIPPACFARSPGLEGGAFGIECLGNTGKTRALSGERVWWWLRRVAPARVDPGETCSPP